MVKDLQSKLLLAMQLLAEVGEPDEVAAVFRTATAQEYGSFCRDLSAITYLTASLLELAVTERGLAFPDQVFNVAPYRLLAMMAEELALGIQATQKSKIGPTN